MKSLRPQLTWLIAKAAGALTMSAAAATTDVSVVRIACSAIHFMEINLSVGRGSGSRNICFLNELVEYLGSCVTAFSFRALAALSAICRTARSSSPK
ncbi:hypothetical protein [Spongiactinospora sp. 9N601]|uniref:hypothetical protein n=1 Tax=Spongiactinospora sp. 9N601 TaxID=3375149 RepID=UPI003795B05A